MRAIDWPPLLLRTAADRPRLVGVVAAVAVHLAMAAAVLLSLRPVTPPPEDRPLSISLVTLEQPRAARPGAASPTAGRDDRRVDETRPPSPSVRAPAGLPAPGAGVGTRRTTAPPGAPPIPGLGRFFQCLNDAASVGDGPEAEACRRWRKAHIEPGGPPEKLLIDPGKEAGYAAESRRRSRPAAAPVTPCQGPMSNLDFGCPPPKSR